MQVEVIMPSLTGDLRGPLPRELNRAATLSYLMASDQSLEGTIPHLTSATLTVLSVQSNRLKVGR